MTENNASNQIDLAKIKWYRTNSALQDKDIYLLDQLPYLLPKRYVELLKISNGGRLEADTFDFYDRCFK